ncbi:MAG: GntR family transcriptional regulator [Pseudomonadota bacterium]
MTDIADLDMETPARPSSGKRAQTDRVYDRLKHMILEGELLPGGFVLQEELGDRIGVSRTPIREALIRLQSEGLIEIRPRHGMRVLPVSVSGMREIYEVLTGLEAHAAKIVAERGAETATLAKLDEAVAEMDRALAIDDLAAWAEADDRFHTTLVAATGNQRLIDIMSKIFDQAYRVRKLTLKLRPKPVRSNAAHRAVVEAIRDRDQQGAYRIHEQHRRESGKMLIALLEKLEITAA